MDELHKISGILIERETIDKDQFERLLAGEDDATRLPEPRCRPRAQSAEPEAEARAASASRARARSRSRARDAAAAGPGRELRCSRVLLPRRDRAVRPLGKTRGSLCAHGARRALERLE